MSRHPINRRRFIREAAALGAAGFMVPSVLQAAQQAAPRTARDLVPLGKKGVMISRLGFGTGSMGGSIQRKLGQTEFTRLIHYAFDRGITYIDTADAYGTHEMVRKALRGLPRESLFIQSKMRWDAPSVPEKPGEVLDRFRKELDTDYIDSLLIHCANQSSWPEHLERMMDAFSEAQQRKRIRLKGVSCHGLPALTRAAQVDWVDVHLVRINPQGKHVDGAEGRWDEPGNVPAVMREVRTMHANGRGVIGMKMIGNGDFRNAADREKAIRHAMTCGCVDAVVVGFASTAEIDEAIQRINRALAEA